MASVRKSLAWYIRTGIAIFYRLLGDRASSAGAPEYHDLNGIRVDPPESLSGHLPSNGWLIVD